MLGEDHSLINEFPEYKDTIFALIECDKEFSEGVTRYNNLDKEIRELELGDAPIGDEAMHQLKHDRAVLKDTLYQRLVNEEK